MQRATLRKVFLDPEDASQWDPLFSPKTLGAKAADQPGLIISRVKIWDEMVFIEH